MARESTETFRDRVRAGIGRHYSGRLHFAFTTTLALTVIVLAVRSVSAPSWRELLTVPITFLYANAVEWMAHRGPMHRPARFLSLIYKRHSLEHHAFFTTGEMAVGSWRDFKYVLFPPVMIFFFFGLFAVPVGLVLRWVAGANVSLLFVATAMGYFLTYEWLHTSYHLGEGHWVGRLPFVQTLRRHHATHHDPALMSRYNFNITFPICDALFGTAKGPDARTAPG
jgi:hypothetical protein